LSNLHAFADTARYGFKFYTTIFSLTMTIALLLQDPMGDFFSSMFVTSGLFGLAMYLAGVISILLYRPLLPIPKNTGVENDRL
jgi:hypothetical protein